ncbi:methionyl-tRNA formyltransferase [Kaarinaea lacus]
MNMDFTNAPLSSYKIVFFGSLGVMSYATLLSLLQRRIPIAAVVIPGVKPEDSISHKVGHIPVVQTPKHDTIELLALEHNIPIVYVKRLDDLESYSLISKYEPHFIWVACFPYILPAKIWQLAKIASINLHPSLLPKYRGPNPVFWQLKQGEARTGITLHLINDLVDGGDILLHKDIPFKNGIRDRAISTLIGEQGAKLFIEILRLYQKKALESTPQNPATASYMGSPQEQDFELHTTWSAQHAFNFMRGTEDWKTPYNVHIGGKNLRLESAIAYSPAGAMEEDYRVDEHLVFVRFAQGVLQAYSIQPFMD